MDTRQVRGDSGAVFEVEPGMLPPEGPLEPGYRDSAAPPRTSSIVRPPDDVDRSLTRSSREVYLVSVVMMLCVILSLGQLR